MTSYYCPICKTNRFAPVCPVCLEASTGVQVESFVVSITFVLSYRVGNDLVDFEITPNNRNGINIRTAETNKVKINNVQYNLSSYVTRDENNALAVSDNDAYLSRGYPYYHENISRSAKDKGIDLVLSIADLVFSGAYDDILIAAEIISTTRKYETAEGKYIEALEAALQYQREKNAYMESLVTLGANLRASL